MKNETETMPASQKLRDELKALVAEAETLMAGALAEPTNDVPGNLHARFNAAQERVADACAGAKKGIIAGAKSTDATIRENPYQSLALTLGMGLLVGVLLGRYSK
jgi:ElaB/YqjD/DUF883 family membrane-anchored ribosome-binding protein